jgi:flagellar biosynthesis/type III secretory pathway protein FliH
MDGKLASLKEELGKAQADNKDKKVAKVEEQIKSLEERRSKAAGASTIVHPLKREVRIWQEGRKEGRKEGREEGRKEGGKAGRGGGVCWCSCVFVGDGGCVGALMWVGPGGAQYRPLIL